jgi:hypothetical protein
MTEVIETGTWVEIHRIVLKSGERAARVPEDTRRVPLEMRVKGFLVAPASPGAAASIVTSAGRKLHGTLVAVNPAYTHGFGAPLPELSAIGEELRAILRERGHLK